MGYSHTTEGGSAFPAFLKALSLCGIKPEKEYEGERVSDYGPLRKAIFRLPGQENSMVVEEYLAVYDPDCDGTSSVAIEVYPEGERPDLEARTRTPEQLEEEWYYEQIGDDPEL